MDNNERKPDIDQLKPVARETLTVFEQIVAAATAALKRGRTHAATTLVHAQTFTGSKAINEVERVGELARDANFALVHQPAIARVVVVDADGDRDTFYVTRAAAPSGFPKCASAHAPLGRLASLPVGGELTVGGRTYEVLERARLRPEKIADVWDSKDTIFEAGDFSPITVESLRRLLAEPSEDLLEQMLAAEAEADNVIRGIRRRRILKMELRDQPTLDQFQDEIFRLPLDNRLLLVGPPGTGKTTTLIRRLGQKLDLEYLDEREVVEKISAVSGLAHGANWVMFSPTDLLKQFLKEAFNVEQIAASDSCVRTWNDFRRVLARETFGVLRTLSGNGSFVLKETAASVRPEAIAQTGAWFSDFDVWQRNRFVEELTQSAKVLAEHDHKEGSEFGRKQARLLGGAGHSTIVPVLVSLVAESETAQELLSKLKGETDAEISKQLNLELNRNKSLIEDLMEFMDSLQQSGAADDGDAEDPDVDDDEEEALPATKRGAAINAYRQAVRAQARAVAARRSLSKKSRPGRIAEWLGDRTLTEGRRADVGASLLIQRGLRRFVNPVGRYIDGIPKRYRPFRRERQNQQRWYAADGFSSTDLHPLELDVILLGLLRAGKELLERPNVRPEAPAWSSLKKFADLQRTQVFVDEATDFSPVQLACIAALAHPRLNSLFACGDFNQRLTTWGTRTPDDLEWALPDLDIRKVRVAYRQSHQLNDLATAIVKAVGGATQDVALPEHVDSEGVPAVLLESATRSRLVPWLAERIKEIETAVGQLPSIAVFVPSEDEVKPLAKELNDALVDHNIQVTACSEGQIIGQEHNVRVFDAQHIKGLEFEAVFFVGIDRLAETQPDLFDKYLYVGCTRAATYLGLSCENKLPDAISGLRSVFASDWKDA